MTTTIKPRLLFLGATGGCVLTTLVHALNHGHHCTALARTPSKLTALLRDAGVTTSTMDSHLTIQPGDSTNVSDLKEALLSSKRSNDTPLLLPSTIVSGLGGSPTLQVGLPPFTIDQPSIGQDSATTLVTALSQLYTSHPSLRSSKPLLCFVSTGGMYPGQDDIPWLMRMLYSYVLTVPWQDKRAMERVFDAEEAREVFRAVVPVKVSLLTDGPELGDGKVRVGTRRRPVFGYSIARRDVGGWMYRNVVATEGRGWEGELVSLTY